MQTNEKEYVLISSKFHPDTTSATGQYMTDIVTGLQKRGLNMTVYTRASQHPDHQSEQEEFDYHRATINRLSVPEVKETSMLRRGVNWMVFIVTVTLVLLVSRPKQPREVLFVTYPSILPPFMYLICRIRGWEYTYIVHDFYPDAAVELGYIERDGLIHRLWSALNERLITDAKNVVALGPTMRDRIVDSVAADIEEGTVVAIHHWADSDFIEPRAKEDNWFSEEQNTVDAFTAVYAGNIGEFHDLETVVRAVAASEDENIQLLVIGEGDNKETMIELAEDLGVRGRQVRFLPYQPWEDVPYSLTCGDVSVVAKNEGFEGVSVSSKIYSSLATGQPILVVAQPHADEARTVEAVDGGFAVSPGDTDGVLACLEEWKENPELVARQGGNAREALETRFSRETAIDQYYEVLW